MSNAWGAGELRSTRTIAGGFGNPLRVPMSNAWGAGELRSTRTIAGGFGNPLRVPMSEGHPKTGGQARHGGLGVGDVDLSKKTDQPQIDLRAQDGANLR